MSPWFDNLTPEEAVAYIDAPTRAQKNAILRAAAKRIEAEEREAGLPPRPKPLPTLNINRKGIV